MIIPPPLEPGARIRVVAPSSPFDRTLVWRGLGFLAQRYRLVFEPGMFERDGYLAGSDTRRLEEINAALRDPSARAIVAARGGYGASRISFLADFAALRAHPKWLVGFSDVTALHTEASRAGVASLHAHNAAGLGRSHVSVWEPWLAALEGPPRPRVLSGSAVIVPGRSSGVLLGGNLTVWFTAWAAGRVQLPENFILAFEDVSESSYRLDRMLMALLAAGVFDRCAGVAFGEFVDCPSGKFAVTVPEMLQRCLGHLRFPILAGLPFGHGRHNQPLFLGLNASLDSASVSLETASES